MGINHLWLLRWLWSYGWKGICGLRKGRQALARCPRKSRKSSGTWASGRCSQPDRRDNREPKYDTPHPPSCPLSPWCGGGDNPNTHPGGGTMMFSGVFSGYALRNSFPKSPLVSSGALKQVVEGGNRSRASPCCHSSSSIIMS